MLSSLQRSTCVRRRTLLCKASKKAQRTAQTEQYPALDGVLLHCASGGDSAAPAMVAFSVVEYGKNATAPMLPSASAVRGAALPIPMHMFPFCAQILRVRYPHAPALATECFRVIAAAPALTYMDRGLLAASSITSLRALVDAFVVETEDTEDNHVNSVYDGEARFVSATYAGVRKENLLDLLDRLKRGALADRAFSVDALDALFRNADAAVIGGIIDHCSRVWRSHADGTTAEGRSSVSLVTFYRLLYAIIRNPAWASDATFAEVHDVTLRLLDSIDWSAAARADSSAGSEYLPAIMVRLGRIYGAKQRAFELDEMLEVLVKRARHMLSAARLTFWVWSVACHLDAALSEHRFHAMATLQRLPPAEVVQRLWVGAHTAARHGLVYCRDYDQRVTIWRLALKAALHLDRGDLLIADVVTVTERTLEQTTAYRVLQAYELMLGLVEEKTTLLEAVDAKACGSQLVRWFRTLLGHAHTQPAAWLQLTRRVLRVMDLLSFQRPFGAADYATAMLTDMAVVARSRGISDDTLAEAAAQVRDWVDTTLEEAGTGFGSSVTIGTLHDAAVAAQLYPEPLFRWKCGCGAQMPAAATRCTVCLRSEHHAAWTCLGCKAKCSKAPNINTGALAASEAPEDRVGEVAPKIMAQLQCDACKAPHPWALALVAANGSACICCGACTEAADGHPRSEALRFSEGFAHVEESLGICRDCLTAASPPSAQQLTDSDGLCDFEKPASCKNCGNMSTPSDNLCAKCGVVTARGRRHGLSLWHCGDCSTWNPSFTNVCRRNPAHKRSPSSITAGAVDWLCGCGAENGPLRVSCHQCATSGRPAFTCKACARMSNLSGAHRELEVVGADVIRVPSCSNCGADHPAMADRIRMCLPYECGNCGTIGPSFWRGVVTKTALDGCAVCDAPRPDSLMIWPSPGVQWDCLTCGTPKQTGFTCAVCFALQTELNTLTASGHPAGAKLWKCSAYRSPEAEVEGGASDETLGGGGRPCGTWNPSWSSTCVVCSALRVRDNSEIVARYAPWSCFDCGTRNEPSHVLFCKRCKALRDAPPCPRCGLCHVVFHCPPRTDEDERDVSSS
jgi:hypothetical protein